MFIIGKQRTEAGDTIVEVLIAIAIISIVLAGAFLTTRQSTTAVRSSQEQAQASKLLESQLELLRAHAVVDDAIFTTPGAFCMNTSGVQVFSAAACTFGQSGAVAAAGEQPAYQIRITRNADTFTAAASWTRVGGDTGSAKMFYKVYQ